MWLIWAMVCLLAAPWVQLSVSAGIGWPHNALRHHWLMPVSFQFRYCKSAAGHESHSCKRRYNKCPDLYLYLCYKHFATASAECRGHGQADVQSHSVKYSLCVLEMGELDEYKPSVCSLVKLTRKFVILSRS